MNVQKVLVTGATGYVGGRLVPKLLEEGFEVKAMGRSLQKLKSRVWSTKKQVELVEADVHDLDDMRRAVKDCQAVIYLIHSMLPGETDFASADRHAAETMLKALEESEVEQIIYLGGLGDDSPELSKHLRSRMEVAEILRSGPTPVTILRAAMIIGTGSASFEILRYLVDRLPIMITPKWLETKNQPIAIRNVIQYISGSIGNQKTFDQTFDIGGKDVLTYHDLMRIYQEEAGLPRRFTIQVPVLTPRLSSYWIHIVTPVPASLARPLAEGLKNPVVCRDNRIREIIPQEILDCREAIRRALLRLEEGRVDSHWTDAGKMPPPEMLYLGDADWAGGTVFRDYRQKQADVSVDALWEVVSRIGGTTGWYHADWLWSLRGFLDKMIGGVGLRRGRRDPQNIQVGDALDFWRVIAVEKKKRLKLAAEMKLPGKATLEFKIHQVSEGRLSFEQNATFIPKGLRGILYWYLIVPLHEYVFQGMLNNILKAAQEKKH